MVGGGGGGIGQGDEGGGGGGGRGQAERGGERALFFGLHGLLPNRPLIGLCNHNLGYTQVPPLTPHHNTPHPLHGWSPLQK